MSCATLIHGRRQNINITSSPSGAKVTIDGNEYGNTPTIVKLERKGKIKGEDRKKKGYVVKIELEGYAPFEMNITRQLDGWFLGNFLVALPAFFIDMSLGSMYKLTPKEVDAKLGSK